MGRTANESFKWIDNITYNHLLSELDPQTFAFHQTRILISGFVIDIGTQKYTRLKTLLYWVQGSSQTPLIY